MNFISRTVFFIFISLCFQFSGAFQDSITGPTFMTTISPWMMTDEMRASDRRYDEATRLATNDLAKYIETEGKHSSLALTEAFRAFDVASPEQASLSPMQKAQIMFVNALGHGQSR